MAKSKPDIIKETGADQTKKDPFENLAKQCQAEYNLCWKHQKDKKDEAEVRLRLYNNQMRDKKAVGDTTMFTIHQTVLASLYVDRLDSIWRGKEAGDEEVGENLNSLAENDYKEMQKEKSDYDWLWDASFFGRSVFDFSSYVRDPDKKIYLPLGHVVDPIPFLRDPLATSINGDTYYFYQGAARFFGNELKMTKHEMVDHPHIFEDVNFKEVQFGSGTYSILRDAIEARNQAQGLQSLSKQEQEESLGVNAQYDITKWYTHYEIQGKVKKVIVWLANDRTKVVGLQVLKHDYWPLIDRPLYPHSHDWDGTSIPDLTEDKQRARAVAQNLGMNAMKADLYPMYVYDSNKIVNRKDLKFNFNKFIPVDAKEGRALDAIAPLIKNRPDMQLLDFVYNSLALSAEKATATPEMQQGMQPQKDRTLGETNLIASKVDTRYSLAAKVLGWSEADFWRHWYWSYKDNFTADIDEKVLRLEGAFGTKWRPLKRDNIIAKIDPDVEIESRVLNRAKQLEERNSLTGYLTLVIQDPTSNRRYGLKKLGKLQGLKKDELDRLLPPTIDEREAEEENDKLNDNKFVPVLREQDHNVHNEVHVKANDTPASKAHIKTHNKALMVRRVNPEFFPEMPQATAFQPPGTPKLGTPTTPAGANRPIAPSQAQV